MVEDKLKDKHEKELDELFEIIKLVTPGTKLRTAIDDIARAGLGALIVIGDSPEVLKITNGGFKIDCKFTPQQLVELSKMDGAIILSDDLKKIVYCNTLLVPNPEIDSNETGTRHKAAERTAKQTSRPVVAISERRKTVSLYYKNTKYTLRNTEELLSKAIETLRMLEKHKEILNEALINLNILEFTNLVSLSDVISCIQRIEIITRIAETTKRYLIELGTEGNLVKILLREVIKGIEREEELILKDYSRNWEFTKTALSALTIDELVEPENIIRALLYTSPSDAIKSKGLRLLAKIPISQDSRDTLIKQLGNLQEILNTVELDPNKLIGMIGEKDTNKLIKEISNLKEQALVGKKI
ncbi:MAG: DNA integrity scanning diadenylate cyclase DisA [Candidatus Pacearchaeota archaeon]|nr:DNA integrity scanning diadenylate cyclase DisA [Candidatus Pacearchaeota archaeon]